MPKCKYDYPEDGPRPRTCPLHGLTCPGPKQYTNTREQGEFGGGVTVEKMTDAELVEKLRTVNIATAPYACPEAVDWCHEAADRLAALSPLSPRVKASDILSQVALWSDDEGLDLSMGQGEDLARRIMSAIEVSAFPRVVADEKRAEVREKFAGIHKSLDAIDAVLSSAGDDEPPTDAEAKARLAEIVAKNPEDFGPGTNPLGDTSAALPHMGGVMDKRAIGAAIFDPGAYVGMKGDRTVTEWQVDAVMAALSSHEPTPETKRGIEDAKKRIAETPSGTMIDNLPDEVLFGDHSDENPNVGQSAPTDTQEWLSVTGEALMRWSLHTIPATGTPKMLERKDGDWVLFDDAQSALTACQLEVERLRAENERLRIERITAERDAADYMKRLNKAAGKLSIAENVIAELVKALESCPSDADFANAEGFRQAINSWWNITARAALSQATGGKG